MSFSETTGSLSLPYEADFPGCNISLITSENQDRHRHLRAEEICRAQHVISNVTGCHLAHKGTMMQVLNSGSQVSEKSNCFGIL